jgi:hypothetical protein
MGCGAMYSPRSGLTLNQEVGQTVSIPIPYAQDTDTACKPAITNVVNDTNFSVTPNKLNILHTKTVSKIILILTDTQE